MALIRLKRALKSLDEVPEAYRGLYAQTGDIFDFKGDVEFDDHSELKPKIQEFRNTNIKLAQEKDAALALANEFKELGFAVPAELKAHIESLKTARGEKGEDVETLVQKRTKAMEDEHKKLVTKLTRELEETRAQTGKLRSHLNSVVIDQGIQQAVGKVGELLPKSVQDVLNRGRSVWSIGDDGKPVAKDADGTLMYGAKTDPITMEEWASRLLDEAPHLFKPGRGGGSGGGDGNTNPSGLRVVDSNDPVALGRYADDILAGKAVLK